MDFAKQFQSIVEQIIASGVRYDLVITGTVGSGKSTRFDIISSYINEIKGVRTYPEWIIRKELGKELLKAKLNKEISPFTLQSYILDNWMNELYNNPPQRFNVYERVPHDSNLCFCRDFTNNQMRVLNDKANYIEAAYGVPSYSDPLELEVINSYTSDPNENVVMDNIHAIYDVLVEDLKHIQKKKLNDPFDKSFIRVILLKVPFEVSKHRICNRKREGEALYTDDDIKYFIHKYENLQSFMMMSNNRDSGSEYYEYEDDQ